MSEERVVALLVESEPEALDRVRAATAKAAWLRLHLEVATGLSSALARLAHGDVDVVLLGLWLPDSHGLETFTRLHEEFPNVPIVVLSRSGQEATAIAAMRLGAQDHLPTDRLDADSFSRSIRYAVERLRMQREIRSLAAVDGLTGLYNLRGFTPLAEHHIKIAARSGEPVTLLFIDIEGLPSILETFGRSEASRTLIDTGRVLRSAVRGSDVLARVDESSFCVLLTGETDGAAGRVLTRLVEAIATHKARTARPYSLSLSVGTATYDPRHPCSLEELMHRADGRMREERERQRLAH